MKKLFSFVFGLILIAGTSGTARAVPIVPTDLDGLALGALVDSLSDDFLSGGGSDVGDLDNELYYDGSLYTYVHEVSPGSNFISEFNTAFNVLGFNGVAGWSFSDASGAGGAGTAADFALNLDPDGTLDWETAASLFFGTGDSIRFFFQSPYNAGLGDYNLINGVTGTGTSFAPVPEPATVLLLGTSLLVLGGGLRRKFQR